MASRTAGNCVSLKALKSVSSGLFWFLAVSVATRFVFRDTIRCIKDRREICVVSSSVNNKGTFDIGTNNGDASRRSCDIPAGKSE